MSDRMNKNSDLGIDMKKSYDALHAPDFLKKETLLKMQEAEEQNVRVSEALEDANVGDKSFYYKNKKTLRIVAGLSTVCAAAACFLFVFLSGTPYVTKMDDGMHYDTVELKNGEINFVSKRMAISISPNAGNAFDSVGNAEEAEGMEEFGINAFGCLVQRLFCCIFALCLSGLGRNLLNAWALVTACGEVLRQLAVHVSLKRKGICISPVFLHTGQGFFVMPSAFAIY